MRVKDIMTAKVITVSSNTSLGEADDIMSKYKIRRLPVVDDEKLVGVISKDGILGSSTPYNVPIAPWKLTHYFFGRKVKEVMSKDPVTVTPDTTTMAAAYLAQKNKVGCLPVMDNDKLVGIVTTNDFFYKILNPLLGIWGSGTQFVVHEPGDTGGINGVFNCIKKYNARILAIRYIDTGEGRERNLSVRVETTEENQIVSELKSSGYNLDIVHLNDPD